MGEDMAAKLTDEIIDAAIEGYEQQRVRMDQKIAELRSFRSGNQDENPTSAEPEVRRGRRRMSAAARARIAAAQRARWAKAKGLSELTRVATISKPKRRMSKEGRARIIAATKARWARVRAEKAHAAKKVTGKKAA
jgi:hypothetical protein